MLYREISVYHNWSRVYAFQGTQGGRQMQHTLFYMFQLQFLLAVANGNPPYTVEAVTFA